MASTTIMSYEQVQSRVATFPLPPTPHKNMTLREALALARRWGCKMVLSGSNDMLVSHHIVQNGRYTMPVSVHRKDTSQGLVSFIRRVIDATVIHPDYKRSVPMDDRLNGGLDPSRNGMTRAIGPSGPAMVIEPKGQETDLKQVLEAAQPVTGVNKAQEIGWITYSQEAERYFRSLAEFTHYRQHCSDTRFAPFAACEEGICKDAVRHLSQIAFLGTAAQEFEIELDEQARKMTELTNSEESARKQLAELRPKPQEGQTPQQGAPQIPMDVNARRKRIGTLHLLLMDEARPHWPSIMATHTRMGDALVMLGHKEQWSQELLESYETLDFRVWQSQIMALKPQGGIRNLIGNGGWSDFTTAIGIVKQNRSVKS